MNPLPPNNDNNSRPFIRIGKPRGGSMHAANNPSRRPFSGGVAARSGSNAANSNTRRRRAGSARAFGIRANEPISHSNREQKSHARAHEHSGGTIAPTAQKRIGDRHTSDRNAKRPRPAGRGRPPKRRPIPESSLVSKESRRLTEHFPPIAEGDIRIIPLGGVEEIGKNMTAFETADDLVVVDAGLQFRDEDTPGIDYIIPNTQYLEERKDKIRALLVTHGHLDHIGAISYIMPKIGNPPIYSRQFTTYMIAKRQEEFAHLPPLDLRVIEKDQTITLGKMRLRFFGVSHAIPDSMGISIETPYGDVVHTGDLRVDNKDGVPTDEEQEEFAKFKKHKSLLLLADSTNVENPGFSLAEKRVIDNIEEVIKSVRGRLIIGTFSSQVDRIIKIINVCERHNKKVIIEGRSMKTNIEVAKLAGLLKPKEGTLIPVQDIDSYPPDRIVAIVTGSQGEEFAALMRMGTLAHKYFKIRKGDTVLLSSSIIPGNEMGVQRIKDNLSRQGAKIVHYRISEVHASGHANRDELAWIHRQINPKFFIPIHGHHYMLRVHADVAQSVGIPEENIVVPDNGMLIEIRKGEKMVTLKEKAPSNIVMVDGFSVGDIQEVVIRDRQALAQDGMFVVVVVLDVNSGKVRKSPDLISRGFVYLRESQDLLHDARNLVRRTVEEGSRDTRPINFDYLKNQITDTVSEFLFQKTNKRPIVIPVILGV